jgi:hypothetical protein
MASISTLAALKQAHDHAASARSRRGRARTARWELRELKPKCSTRDAGPRSTARWGARQRLARQTTGRGQRTRPAARRRERLQAAMSARERDVAATEARVRSTEEIEASRATFGDAARSLLNDAGSSIRHQGAVADHLTVERPYERAVDALLGDWLQHVVVEKGDDVPHALSVLASRDAGRCGFLILEEAARHSVADVHDAFLWRQAVTVVRRAATDRDRSPDRTGADRRAFDEARHLRDRINASGDAGGEIFVGAWRVEQIAPDHRHHRDARRSRQAPQSARFATIFNRVQAELATCEVGHNVSESNLAAVTDDTTIRRLSAWTDARRATDDADRWTASKSSRPIASDAAEEERAAESRRRRRWRRSRSTTTARRRRADDVTSSFGRAPPESRCAS